MSDSSDATSARTLYPPGLYGGQTFGGPVNGTIDALRFTGESLVPIVLERNTKFGDYATEMERNYSALLVTQAKRPFLSAGPSPLPPFKPVVNGDGLVIGHHGRRSGHGIFVQERSGRTSLRDLLADGVSVVVGRNPDPATYRELSTSEQLYDVLVDIDGRVVAQTGYDIVGVESADATFWSLVGVGRIIVALGRAGARYAVASLTARKAANTVAQTITLRTGSVSVAEMERMLVALMKERPELAKLYGITVQKLSGEALQKEVLAVLRTWERSYGKTVQFVEKGVVQTLTKRRGNFLSLQGDKLMIEKQVLQDSKQLFKEVVHELTADALKVRGAGIGASQLAFIGESFTQLNNAFFILENAIMRIGGLKDILRTYR